MKRIVHLIVCLVALGITSDAVVARVQVAANSTGAAGATRAVTVSAIGTGNLVYSCGMWTGAGTSSTPTATGLTFTQVGADIVVASNATKIACWYAKNSTSGATAVTFNISVSASFLDAFVLEFSGLDTTAPLRTNQSGQSATGTTASTAAMTVVVGDLIIGAAVAPSVSATNLGVLDSTADGNGLGHTLSAGSTSITPTFTTTSGQWAMISAAFIPASGAPPVIAPPRVM